MSEFITSAYHSYSHASQWEKHLVNQDRFCRFYDEKPFLAKWAARAGAPLLTVAKLVGDPIAKLIGIVAFPIFAKMKKDPTYFAAAAFALAETIFYTGMICLCIFVFSPTTSIIIAVYFTAVKFISVYRSLKENPYFYGKGGNWMNVFKTGIEVIGKIKKKEFSLEGLQEIRNNYQSRQNDDSDRQSDILRAIQRPNPNDIDQAMTRTFRFSQLASSQWRPGNIYTYHRDDGRTMIVNT